MPKIAKKDLPAFVRRCYDQWRKANITTREAENERLRCYAGGELMWLDPEVEKRKAQNRPIITVNRCKPAVDQIEGDVRLNPPGPQVMPVGENADAADPDIIEGMIREIEYRSMAQVAQSTAVKYCGITGYGVIELATEYENDRDDSQQLKILSVEDPSVVFFDPAARMANRQDAMWAGKIKSYTKDAYELVFGKNRRIMQPGGIQVAQGWLADAFGLGSADTASMMEWTGAREDGDGRWRGPFLVCEFYLVETDTETSKQYSDGIWYLDSETPPAGVVPKGKDYEREVQHRKICKYIVDALEAQDDTEWLGSLIPLFPVLGPEIYIDGKLHRLSLISGAIDSNRALNYTATTAAELIGLLPKSPFIGYEGQFENEKWESVNSEIWAYMEVKPTFASDENGVMHLLPPPQRNMWEAPIQWLMQMGQWFADQIKAETSIWDPSLGKNSSDQSGKAIEQLRSESNVANYSYADNLHRTMSIIYQQICEILPQIYDSRRAVSIVRPDSQHEIVRINQVFPADTHEKVKGGYKHKQTDEFHKSNNMALGKYSCRVVVGPNFQTRQDQALQMFLEAVKINPSLLANPAIAAKVVRMIGQGNPEMEGIADLLAPSGDSDVSPAQLQQKLQMSEQQIQVLTEALKRMQMEAKAKLPEIASRERMNTENNVVKLAVAQIGAKAQDDARQSADQLSVMGMAHEVAMQAEEHEHQQIQQESQEQAAAASQTQSEHAAAEQAQAATGENQ